MSELAVRRLGRWAPYIVLPLVALLLVSLHVKAYRPLSPIDEFQHVDALYRASRLEVVRAGDLARPFTLAEAACRGIELSHTPPCNSNRPAREYPNYGYDTADIHSPAYYLLTAAASVPLRLAGVGLVDAGRLVGAIWLAAGLLLIWILSGELGAPRSSRWAACLLAAASMNVLESSATINVDATALSAGGLIAVAALRLEDRRWPPWAAPLAGAIAAGLKVHNLLAAMLGAIYSLLRRRWWPAAGLAAGALAAEGAWLLIRHLLSSASLAGVPSIQAEHVDRLVPGYLVAQVAQLLTPVRGPYVPPFLNHELTTLFTNLENAALVAATLGGALLLPRGGRAHGMAVAVSAAMLLGGPLLTVSTFLIRHSYVPAFPRYGLSLLPAAVAVLAVVAGDRLGRWALWALTAGALGSVLYYLGKGALAG